VLQGPHIKEFERAFAQYIGRRHAVAMPSGRMALYVSLFALGLGKKDAVVLPAYTVPEVVTMLRWAGIEAQFTDINSETYNMDPEGLEAEISENAHAILMTHLYGRPCDVEAIAEIASKKGLHIIEDAAQACGAEYKGQKAGTFGQISYFSFGLVKNLNTLGGGMLTTDDDELAENARKITRHYPYPNQARILLKATLCTILWMATHRILFTFLGYPLLRLIDRFGRTSEVDRAFDEKDIGLPEMPFSYKRKYTNLQASIGIEQLRSLDMLNKRRMENVSILKAGITSLKQVGIPCSPPDHVRDICLNLMVTYHERAKVLSELLRRGVDTTRGYLQDCSGLPVFQEFGKGCPSSKFVSEKGFYLPVNPFQNEAEIEFIAHALHDSVQHLEREIENPL
jgi:dTDP-4-amino-4,6-dideoxygalactose transaminase